MPFLALGVFLAVPDLAINLPKIEKSRCNESVKCSGHGYDQHADNCDCGGCRWNQRENLPK